MQGIAKASEYGVDPFPSTGGNGVSRMTFSFNTPFKISALMPFTHGYRIQTVAIAF